LKLESRQDASGVTNAVGHLLRRMLSEAGSVAVVPRGVVSYAAEHQIRKEVV